MLICRGVSLCLSVSLSVYLRRLIRAQNQDQRRSVILPSREILLMYRPTQRVKPVATEAVQLQSRRVQTTARQTAQSRPQ